MIPTQQQDKRQRNRGPAPGRYVSAERIDSFSSVFRALSDLAFEGMRVSANVVDLKTRVPVVSIDEGVALPTASIGKVLLLIEASARMTRRDFSGLGVLDKTPDDSVADSGLWQHLQAPALPVADIAALIGSASDNLATNVLLRAVGVDAVRRRSESLGLRRTTLLDVVRNERGPDDAPQLSVGSTAELTWLFGALSRGEVVDPVTSQRVLGWLSLNSDLSMVASAFGLDPLAHRREDHGLLLVNKTGTDLGIRAEVGAFRGPRAGVAYSVIVQFDDSDLIARLRVLDAMRTVGQNILEYVH